MQFVGVIGQGFEVLAAENHGTGIILRIDLDLRAFFLNVHLLLLDLDFESDVELRDLTGVDLHIVLDESVESLRVGGHGVAAWRQIPDFIVAVVAGCGGVRRAAGLKNGNRGVRNDGARRIGDLAPECAGASGLA